MRFKAFMLYAMGDDDPYDGTATGFDTILDNPNFAGGTTSFWQRQQIPFVFGGGVALSGVNSIVPSLRSSKTEGQSNFVNPGLLLLGIGADADIAPQWRLIGNVSWLSFMNTSTLEFLRNQGGIARFLGTDISVAVQYRPYMTQNIVFNASVAFLQPGQAYRQLFPVGKRPYSMLANLLLTF